jgi:hypothetical protein
MVIKRWAILEGKIWARTKQYRKTKSYYLEERLTLGYIANA